ncbi:type II toxin-antitoxin system toxin DNA ADP-ribosyl transferase DarT [Halopseudomonas pelagia]|uniref:type II toxin-antitoxin system toxin DNA ADP-ribosyl transferase DarT n=1 Tax=Halopseudomonas pelagia TaxID=553151 RepID=UPI0030DD3A14|tara:strand:- start:228 stop:869 length:642 start_codon:yes stop_codon:yes gene_type:complete
MTVPAQPKIYHIVHVDRLASILADQMLWSDAQITARAPAGTTIGMSGIKQRRLTELTLTSHPDLYVGACVPFYFCPRSIMLYLIYQANSPDLSYKGGQGPIIHLESDLHSSVAWAEENQFRWAFTLSNAGSYYFEDRSDLARLNEINWEAVRAQAWSSCKDGKQAEFLLESCYPWHLVERIGVSSQAIYTQVANILAGAPHRPSLQIIRDWYY